MTFRTVLGLGCAAFCRNLRICKLRINNENLLINNENLLSRLRTG
jgi:hypothetical protein